MEDRFVEVTIGVKSSRNTAIPITDLSKAVAVAQKRNQDLYRSYFLFDNGINEHLKQNKSIEGFNGNCYVDKIVFDIDKGKETDDNVHQRTKSLILDLIDEWNLDPLHIHPFYSGSGFHVEIPDIFRFGKVDLAIYKNTITKYFKETDDLFYPVSLIRVANTINKKTKRYKIPLTVSEVMNLGIQDIIALAQSPRELVRDESLEPVPDHSSKILKSKPVAEKSMQLPDAKTYKIAEATRTVTCVQNMYAKGPQPGTRHNVMLRMTSAFRRSGVPRSAVITMMQSWAKGMDAAEVAKHVGDVFDKGYKYGCNDSLMSKHCDPHCIYFKKKNYNVETSDTDSMRKTYAEYLRKLQNGKSINLKDYYSMAKDFKMLPGEFITVIGDTGIGKTAWVQNLVVDFKVKTLYLSLEVHEALLFRRFIQIANNLTKEDVDNSFLHLNENVLDALTKNIKHINVCTVPPTLNAIERMIAEDQPQLVVIDTLDGIDVEGKTITEKTMIISPELKRIANATNTVIIGIHHISKSAAIDNTGIRKHLNVHSGIGASSTEHKADKLIGIEADGGNHTPLRHITSLKARDEAPFIRMPFHYDIKTFKFKQINQRLELGGKNE